MQEKLAITVLVVTLALFALVMVLYDLMTNKKDDFNQIVLSQQEYDSRTIPFRRGDILDRNGTYLATSEKVYNLILDPKQIMSDSNAYLEAASPAQTCDHSDSRFNLPVCHKLQSQSIQMNIIFDFLRTLTYGTSSCRSSCTYSSAWL